MTQTQTSNMVIAEQNGGVEGLRMLRNNKNHITFAGPVPKLMELIPKEYNLSPLVNNGLQNPDQQLICRDDGFPLGTVGNSYQLFQPYTVIEESLENLKLATSLLGETIDPYECDGQLTLSFHGAVVDFSIILDKVVYHPNDGHALKAIFRIRDSVNGWCSLNGLFGMLRAICMNRMIVAENMLTIRYTHTKNVERGDIINKLSQVFDLFPQYVDYFNTLEGHELRTDVMEYLTKDKEVLKKGDTKMTKVKSPFKAVLGKTIAEGINEMFFEGTYKGEAVPGLDTNRPNIYSTIYNGVTYLAQQKSNTKAEEAACRLAPKAVEIYRQAEKEFVKTTITV